MDELGPRCRKLYQSIFESLDGDVSGRLASQSYLDSSTAVYHGEVITMGFIPQIYSTQELCYFKRITDTTYGILEAITERFCVDAEYRKLFRFSPLLEYLILLPTGYECTIPIARIDIFCDLESGDFKFCEFNTDGSSAMNEDREICNALALSNTFQTASEALRSTEGLNLYPQELFDPWVEEFGRIYEDFARKTPCAPKPTDPVIAIVDYMDKTTIHELREFRERFVRQGYRCLICDMSSLSYHDEVLYGVDVDPTHPYHQTPLRIDTIYRRAVTSDIMEDLVAPGTRDTVTPGFLVDVKHAKGAIALIAAARDRSVCLIGGFKTQVAHSKTSFRMLHHPMTLAFLTDEQRSFIKDHVPFTTDLIPEAVEACGAADNKDAFIIKPVDGYGTKGVYAGQNHSATQWQQLLVDSSAKGYVLQEYCHQYTAPNTRPVPFDAHGNPLFSTLEDAARLTDESSFEPKALIPYNVLTGLFAYGGRFTGVYMRAGTDALIVGFRGGVALGAFIAHDAGGRIDNQTETSATHNYAIFDDKLEIRLRRL
ncbi:MAG: hypothetical protein FWD43_00250 [Coriobacteriia bacterium]|nr:hypothetical protein [Coriobacteriia bacterium]